MDSQLNILANSEPLRIRTEEDVDVNLEDFWPPSSPELNFAHRWL